MLMIAFFKKLTENSESINLLFQFPKFCLVIHLVVTRWKMLPVDWKESQENVSNFSLLVLNFARESCFTLSFNYALKSALPKMQTDNFQRRGPLRKIMETLKTSVFSFIIVNLVNKGERTKGQKPFVENCNDFGEKWLGYGYP